MGANGGSAVTAQEALTCLERAMTRVGLDEDRKKMMRDIFMYGEPVNHATPELAPLPDVQAMQMALETVQTWFHARPSTPPALAAELMRTMKDAGYPIEGGIQ